VVHVEDRALAFIEPLCPDNLFGHLVATAVPGVEEWHDGAYRRTLALPGTQQAHHRAPVSPRRPVAALGKQQQRVVRRQLRH